MRHPLHTSEYRPPFDSSLHRLDARTKLIGTMALVIVVVSTPPQAYGGFAGYAILLVAGLAIGRVPIGYVLARWLIVLPFLVGVAAVPFLGPGDVRVWGVSVSQAGLLTLWNVVVKASLSVAAMTLLIGSTHFSDLLGALDRLRVPRVLVMLIGTAHRYAFILVDEARRMKRARDARGFGGRWVWQAGVIGRMVGTLFLRSYERAERVHEAMLARGFNGTNIVGGHAMRLGIIDLLAMVGWATALISLRIAAAWARH